MTGFRDLGVALLTTLLFSTYSHSQPVRPLTFLSKQCNENAVELRLDPVPLQDLVGSEFKLVLEQGKARVLIVVQDCSQYWINGENFGPTQEVHLWVMIQGPGDIRPVVGSEQSQPTKTWFGLFMGCNNPRVRETKLALGSVEYQIDSLSLDPPGVGWGGRVYLEGKPIFMWHVPLSTKPPVRLIGINHDIYARDSTGNVVFKRVQALGRLAAAGSQGTLNVAGQSNLFPFIHPGTYTVSVRPFFPIWVRTTLGLSPSD